MNDVSYYLSLPSTIELIREDESSWFARVVELPGCISEGYSAEDAVSMIQDAKAGWLELAIQDGRTIPEPRAQEEFSGKFVIRVPKSLHRDLVDAAARKQVRLNQFIPTELARAVGRPLTQPAPARPGKAAPVPRQAPHLQALHEVGATYHTGLIETSDTEQHTQAIPYDNYTQ